MAFTDAQKAAIRHWCGWSPRYAQVPEQMEHEAAINSIEAFPEQQTLCETALAELAAHWALRGGILGRMKAAKVGDIETRGTEELQVWRSVGKQLSADLALLLGAPLGVSTPWGTTGPRKAVGWNGYGGGSGDNYIRQG